MFKVPFKSIYLLLASILFISVSACAKVPNDSKSSQQSLNDQPLTASNNLSDEDLEAWLTEEQSDGKVALKIGKHDLRVEYADSQQERALGLMYRRELCKDCGMLFKFDYDRIGSIWMKNTYVALDLAYIDSAGKIVDIFQLQPHDLTPVRSSEIVLYALEMNQGWFAKQDIRVGDTVTLLP
jgi:uncharacterized membrane protein (UPF0127 family)